MKNQEDEFYAEMDKKTLRRSCCTTQTMLIFFLIILLGAAGATFYFYRAIKKINFSPKSIVSTLEDQKNFSKKLRVVPGQETFEVAITSEELTAATSEGILGKSFIIKNTQVIISKSGIDIFGTLIKPLNSQIKIETQPKAEGGKIKFEVQKTKAGTISMPKFVNNDIANILNRTMDQNFAPLYENYEVTNIELFDDKMVISGKLR